jgi:hypothetical protein
MPDDALRAKVIKIALEYSSFDGEELLSTLEYEWDRAGLAVADRGPVGDHVRRVVTQVWQQARRQRDSVEVITAMSADSALHWAAQYHYASDQYALVVGLIAAWVARAILDDPDDRGPEDHDPPDGK